jgi:hypothetical protein
MHLRRPVLFGALLVVLGAWTGSPVVHAQDACNVDSNGFLGEDQGAAIIVAFLYHLYVTADSADAYLATATALLPTLEIAMAEALAARVIESCAGAESNLLVDIIGFDTQPADEIVTLDDGNPQECGDADNCFVVHSEWTVYIPCTETDCASTDVAGSMLLVLGAILRNGNSSMFSAYVNPETHPGFVSIRHILKDATAKTTTPTKAATETDQDSPTASSASTSPSANSDDSPTKSPTGSIGLFDISGHRDENALLFYGVLFAAGVGLLFFCGCLCNICKKKKGGRDRGYDSDGSDSSASSSSS